ncbi:MAG: flavin reductase family protein, partial [Muribaculaceae bacterium]|nr:flavin reductase family protein [Muribaculaceae bacterium]
KQDWKPGTMVYPLPAVLVSCADRHGRDNIITVAWTGTICTDPAMLYISVRPERFSYDLIKESMEFTVNLTTREMARATDWCGVRSGRDFDKWKECGLTRQPGVKVSCPSIAESPLNIECRVTNILPLGTHHMFMAQVVNVRAARDLIDPVTGAFDLEAAGLISYSHGHYYTQGDKIGKFGWTVRKSAQKK